MLRLFVMLCVAGFAGVCLAEDSVEKLPQPHYRPQKSDPGWLKNAVQFHGHLGPMMVFGRGWEWLRCVPSMPKATSTWKSSAKDRWRNPRRRAFSTACKSAPARRWENEISIGLTRKRSSFTSGTRKPERRPACSPPTPSWRCCGSRWSTRRDVWRPEAGRVEKRPLFRGVVAEDRPHARKGYSHGPSSQIEKGICRRRLPSPMGAVHGRKSATGVASYSRMAATTSAA